MSRLYEQASEGQWLPTACPRCAGDNQRIKNWQQRMFWWSNPLDSMCGLCRCEQEAEEQEYAERNQRDED